MMKLLEHVCPEGLFAKLSQRWAEIEEIHLTELDPLLHEALKQINAIPEIVTVFSCQGHPERAPKDRSGYLLLAVSDVEVVYEFHALFRDRWAKEHRVNTLTFTLAMRGSPLAEDLPNGVFYPAVIMSWPVSTQEQAEYAAKCLHDAALEYQRAQIRKVDNQENNTIPPGADS